MNLCRFSSTVESSNGDPNPKNQTKTILTLPVTDPLHWPAVCKILERRINTRLIWYLEKYRILDRSQCGLRKHRSTTDHLVSLEGYLRDAFAQRQQAVGLFFDLENAYETTWQYGIIRDLHRIGLRGRLPVFVSEYLGDRRIRVRIGTTLSDEFYPEEGVPTGGVLAVTCFGLKINELPSCIAKDIFKALFVDDLAICLRGLSLDNIETSTAGSECHTGMGDKEWLQVCSPQVQSHTFHCTTVSGSETPHCEDWKHFCQWRSPRNSLGCGGTRASHLRSTSVCWRHSTRRLSTSSEWSLTWNGEGTETHSWCCTVLLFVPSLPISRMVRRPAASCPRDSWITAPSLLLRLQPLPWHWTIIGTWTLYSTMLYSTRTQCLACRLLRAKIRLSFVISWTSSGHWATKAHMFASAGCQAIVALRTS